MDAAYTDVDRRSVAFATSAHDMMDLRASLSRARWGAPLVSLVLLGSHLEPLSPQPARGEAFAWEAAGPAPVPVAAGNSAAAAAVKPTIQRLPPIPFGRGPIQFAPTRARKLPAAPPAVQRLPAAPLADPAIQRLPSTPAAPAQPEANVEAAAPPTTQPAREPAGSATVSDEGPQLELDQAEIRIPPTGTIVSDLAPPDAVLPATPAVAPAAPAAIIEPLPALPPAHIEPLPKVTQAAPPAISPAMANVVRQAEAHTQRGMELGGRRAYYSARVEFVQALKLIAGALDAEQGGDRHGQALAAGLRALDEADDFVAQDADVSADIDVAAVAAAHRTPVVRTAPPGVAPLAALHHYFTYAQEQLGASVEQSPAGSAALAGLGKLHSVMALDRSITIVAAEPKALVLHQAALLADTRNALAANELGVLLARFGRYDDARAWLAHSVALAPLPATWHNLAVVHDQLGQPQLAEQARRQQLARQQGRGKPTSNAPDIRWVTAQEFAGRPSTNSPAGTRDTTVRLPSHENPR